MPRSVRDGGGEEFQQAMDLNDKSARDWYAHKSARMEEALGAEHDMVMHAVVPYAVGGGLDLYYYPNGIPGTAIATKELSERRGEGSSNKVFQCYEMVMFTREHLDLDKATDASTPFGRAHAHIKSILNCLARYSAVATLNPNETCEFPAGFPRVGGRCMIFDAYSPHPSGKTAEFGLLAVIEVHQSEVEYARRFGGAKLLERLKASGHYPYSDPDRKPVV